MISVAYLNNESGADGGAVALRASAGTLIDFNTFRENKAAGRGGAIELFESAPYIVDTRFRLGTANFGGGVALTGVTDSIAFENCEFVGNTATNGGGFYSDGGSHTIDNARFVENTAGSGAGIWNQTGSLRIRDSFFVGNAASAFGGGIYNSNGTTAVGNTVFADNAATTGGGSYDSSASQTSYVNCVFAAQQVVEAGAVYAIDSTATLNNATIVANLASSNGAGTTASGAGSLDITHAVFWNNVDASGVTATTQVNGSATVQYSCLQDDAAGDATVFPGTGNIDSDPLFGTPIPGLWTDDAVYSELTGETRLFGNFGDPNDPNQPPLDGRFVRPIFGQPEETIIVDVFQGEIVVLGDFSAATQLTGYEILDYRLEQFSPARDSGSNGLVPRDELDLDRDADPNEALPIDIDGENRVRNLIVDMGAYENFPDCNGNGIEDTEDIASGLSLDCDGNQIPDECQIASDSTAPGGPYYCMGDCDPDCNNNGIPDSCETDCNGNGIPDDCDLDPNDPDGDGEVSLDCNLNAVPDECDEDCDGNGIPDNCQIDVNSTAPGGPFFCTVDCDPDCDNNGIPDACDPDCNGNAIPDACDIDPNDPDGDGFVLPDCNGDGNPDSCDLDPNDPDGNGLVSCDENTDLVPDECQVLNLNSGFVTATIQEGIDAASGFDALLAAAERFELDSADFSDKSITLLSRAAFTQAQVLIAADSSRIEARNIFFTSEECVGGVDANRPAAAYELAGSLTVPNLDRVDLIASTFTMQPGAGISIGAGGGLDLQVDSGATLAGTVTLQADAVLAASTNIDSAAAVLSQGGTVAAPALTNAADGTWSGWGEIAGNLANQNGMTVQADTQTAGDLLNDGLITIQNGTLTVTGTVTNNGTIIGDLGRSGDDRSTLDGLASLGNLAMSGDATLRLPTSDYIVRVGGNFDVAINSEVRYDLAQAELRMIGLATQTLEVMSHDIGADADGLDRTLPGHYPIRRLRVGPTSTNVKLVDVHDNDGLGQVDCEAIYVSELIIDAGASLQTTGCKIYYETLQLDGFVDSPGNLIPITACPGDVNGDDVVNLTDLATLLANFGTTSGAVREDGDLNGDGDVDLSDLAELLSLFGTDCGPA